MLYRSFAAVLVLLLAAGAAYPQECIDYQPNEMEILDTLVMPGDVVYQVVIEGDVAYVGTAYYLHTVDISAPSNLRLLDSIQYNALHLAVNNGLVCLSTQDDDLHFIDATDPENLVFIKTIVGLFYLQNVIAHGDYFYVGALNQGLQVIDATDPTDPVLASSLETPASVRVLAASGSYLYTIGYETGLSIFSLTDPANPSFISLSTAGYGNNSDILVNGNYVYIASYSRGIKIIDVSNPYFPILMPTLSVYGSVYSLAQIGNTLFAGNDPTLQSFDVTNPDTPFQLGRSISSLEVYSLAAYGEYLIGVADGSVLFSMDVSQPVSTLPLANHFTGGDASNITFDGFYGFVANGDEGLFIRSAASAGEVSVTPLPGFLHNVTLDGDLAYLPMDDWGLQIADVSDVTNPILLDDINTSGHARDVAVYHNASGTYALVADTEYDLASYDATDPTHILPKGVTYFTGQVYDIEVYGDYALISDNSGALHVVDVSLFPDPLQVVASLEVPGSPIDLFVQDEVVFVSGGGYMNSVDLGDPLAPQLLDTLETSFPVLDVTVKDGVAYVSISGSGMRIVDVSDPASMQSMSRFRTLGSPAGLEVHEETVFLCVGDDGLVLLPLQCLLSPVDNDLPGSTAGILGQAYPNPFNPRTTIAYDLPRASAVDLRVYDLAGRLVRTLVTGQVEEAGLHTIQWDGMNNAGGAVPSGVYLYRINAAGHQESRRMVLLR